MKWSAFADLREIRRAAPKLTCPAR